MRQRRLPLMVCLGAVETPSLGRLFPSTRHRLRVEALHQTFTNEESVTAHEQGGFLTLPRPNNTAALE